MAANVTVVGPRGGNVDLGLTSYMMLAVYDFAKQLGISRLKTKITIKVHHNLFVAKGTEGLCECVNDREFIINVALYGNWLSTLAHEMVHVKQFARKELNPSLTKWKSRSNVSDIDYWDQPWEKEARRLQHKLVLAFEQY
jgi:hypothetical protein